MKTFLLILAFYSFLESAGRKRKFGKAVDHGPLDKYVRRAKRQCNVNADQSLPEENPNDAEPQEDISDIQSLLPENSANVDEVDANQEILQQIVAQEIMNNPPEPVDVNHDPDPDTEVKNSESDPCIFVSKYIS